MWELGVSMQGSMVSQKPCCKGDTHKQDDLRWV